MADSVYKVIELVGTSTDSWEKAARAAVERASQSLRDLRVAEVVELDMQITEGKVEAYRAKVKVSFKYEGEQWLCSGCKLCPPVECHLGMSMDNLPAIAAGHEPSTYAKPDLAQPRSGTSCGRSGRIAPSDLCCSRLLSLDFP